MRMWISTKARIRLKPYSTSSLKTILDFPGFKLCSKIIILQLLNTCGRCWEFHICKCLPTLSPPWPVRGPWPAESPWHRVSSLVWWVMSDDALMTGQSTLTGHRMTGCREIFAIGCYPRYWLWPLLWFPLVVNISAARVRGSDARVGLEWRGLVVRGEAGQHWSDHRGLIADTQIERRGLLHCITHVLTQGDIWWDQISGNYMAHICTPQ